MSQDSRSLFFRKRTVLGAALVAGIGLGVYLGNMKGLGLGRGFVGEAGGKNDGAMTSSPEKGPHENSSDHQDTTDIVGDDLPTTVPSVVRVVIDDRQYRLRHDSKETPLSLKQLITLIKDAPGDREGIRVRIYQKMTARASAEEDLKKELIAAGIPDSAVIWVPAEQGK